MRPELSSSHMGGSLQRGERYLFPPELESSKDAKSINSRLLVVDFDVGAVSVHNTRSSSTSKPTLQLAEWFTIILNGSN